MHRRRSHELAPGRIPSETRRRRRLLRVAASTALVAATATAVIVPALRAATQTVVSLSFDNDTYSAYTLGYQQALQPHAVRATFYVNSGSVGSSTKYMSWSQLGALATAGDEIGGKTVDGSNLTTLTTLKQITEICNDRQSITQHRIMPFSFAYPAGAFNTTIESEVQNCGYENGRTAGSLSPTGSTYAETLPPKNWLALRAYAPTGQVTLSNLESLVTGAASHIGGWVPIVIQKVCSFTLDSANYTACTSSSGWIDLGDLNTFLSWVQGAGHPNGAPTGTVFHTTEATAISADTVAPTTTISCNGSPCQSTTYFGTVKVTLLATDLGSGVASTHYTTDGTTPTLSSPAYTGSFALTAPTTVEDRSWDSAGNVEAVHSQALSILESADTTPPVTTITCNGATCSTTPYIGQVTVTLSATDSEPGGWGVAITYYTTNGSAPTSSKAVYTGPFTLTQSATVKYFSTDLASNSEQAQSRQIRVQSKKTVVSLTFDDQYENQYLYAVPLLQQYSMNGTFYVITADSDGPYPCCMSWAQLRSLQAQGDDIGSHTIDHPNLTTVTTAQITQEVCGSLQDLTTNGIQHPESFAYPFGAYNSTVESIVHRCGLRSARQGGGISSSSTTPGPPYVETLPPKDPFAVRTIAVDGANSIQLSDLESFVTAAAAQGGAWLPITFHEVCDANAADYRTCMSTYGPIQDTVFGQFLAWLKSTGQPGGAPAGVAVQTMRGAMNTVNGPHTTPP